MIVPRFFPLGKSIIPPPCPIYIYRVASIETLEALPFHLRLIKTILPPEIEHHRPLFILLPYCSPGRTPSSIRRSKRDYAYPTFLFNNHRRGNIEERPMICLYDINASRRRRPLPPMLLHLAASLWDIYR